MYTDVEFCYGCYYTRNVNGLCDDHYDILEREDDE